MTNATNFVKTQGEHSEAIADLKQAKTDIYSTVNILVADAKVTAQINKTTLAGHQALAAKVEAIGNKQIECVAERRGEEIAGRRDTGAVQRWGIWAGIGSFVVAAFTGMCLGVYKVITLMIEASQAPPPH